MPKKSWKEQRTEELIAKHGELPPPWSEFPDTHPCEIVWRMGSGEDYLDMFYDWWDSEKEVFTEARRIEYFRRWPPPHRWLRHMIDCIWDLQYDDDDAGDDEEKEKAKYAPYLVRTSELGFGSEEDYERDFNEFGQEEFDDDDDDDDEDADEIKDGSSK
ncbi:hypothetical protein O9K51_09917 [Purpureocillium lavendulum]|uniref:Uncharacterized protein n=1 Tax=Purpureocillium lavendulum TaxID=1247861 RepID=A0AB34FFC3_9HYPO|nr:hypothetical protein O9K51_09917 [Purpureocillium lavendulum]